VGKTRHKKIVVVKLIIQKKTTMKNIRYGNNKKLSLLVKVMELFLRRSILVLAYKREL
jgi:hypothetical protein